MSKHLHLPVDTATYIRYEHKAGILYRTITTSARAQAGQIAGSSSVGSYTIVMIKSVNYKAHRIAWFLYYGVDPGMYQIDHIDGNKQNNSIRNLRLADNSFNQQANKNKTARGYYKQGNSYIVSIQTHNVTTHIGSFTTEAKAKEAYKLALEKLKPIYKFTEEEQAVLDKLHSTYPNCSSDLQRSCHDIHVKAVTHYVDAAIVQTVN